MMIIMIIIKYFDDDDNDDDNDDKSTTMTRNMMQNVFSVYAQATVRVVMVCESDQNLIKYI